MPSQSVTSPTEVRPWRLGFAHHESRPMPSICTNPNGTATPAVMLVSAAALRLLVQARAAAREVGQDPWEFALEIRCLRAAGLTHTHLRWLICKGYVVHAEERTSPREARRRFERVGNLKLGRRTCCVLTEAGAAHALARLADEDKAPHALAAAVHPVWDAERRELRYGAHLVKRFKQPADNQELILSAFEEEHWPAHIDDPLPPAPEQDCKKRLNATIASLNRHQQEARIHFEGGGDGQTIQWRIIPVDITGSSRLNGRHVSRTCAYKQMERAASGFSHGVPFRLPRHGGEEEDG